MGKTDFKKFGRGFKEPDSWWKSFAQGIKFIIILGILYAIYAMFSNPAQTIVAKKGSNVQVTQINKVKRFFTVFAEMGVEHRADGSGVFTRLGGRIEF
jgi:hypothetical protein